MLSYLFEFLILDKRKVVHVQVYGTDKVSTEVNLKNQDNVQSLFEYISDQEI